MEATKGFPLLCWREHERESAPMLKGRSSQVRVHFKYKLTK